MLNLSLLLQTILHLLFINLLQYFHTLNLSDSFKEYVTGFPLAKVPFPPISMCRILINHQPILFHFQLPRRFCHSISMHLKNLLLDIVLNHLSKYISFHFLSFQIDLIPKFHCHFNLQEKIYFL